MATGWRIKTDTARRSTQSHRRRRRRRIVHAEEARRSPAIEHFEGKISSLRGQEARDLPPARRIVIAGGGDSALDWTINLAPIAERLTLIHRRDEFRGAPESVDKMRALVAPGKIDLGIADILGLKGEGGVISAVSVKPKDGEARDIPCETLSPSTDSP